MLNGSGFESIFVPGAPWVPRKARFPTSLRVAGPQLYVWAEGSQNFDTGPGELVLWCCRKGGAPIPASSGLSADWRGRFQGCCLVFVFVWALTLFHALGTVGTRPDLGTVLCCAYVSPVPQESEQEGLPHSWITRLHFCQMWGIWPSWPLSVSLQAWYIRVSVFGFNGRRVPLTRFLLCPPSHRSPWSQCQGPVCGY